MSMADTRRQATLWLALVLLVGITVGGVFGYALARKSYASTNSTAAPMPSEAERRAKRVADLTREVGLTAEQSQRLDGVILKAHEDIKAIHDHSESEADAVRMKARMETRSFLTEEQKPKFEEFMRKVDEVKKKAGQK